MAKDFLKTQLNRIKDFSDEWVPILLPKQVLHRLLKESFETERKEKAYLTRLKDLKKAFKKAKLFEGMTKEQIMKKLHKTKEQLLRENPNAYIDYNS